VKKGLRIFEVPSLTCKAPGTKDKAPSIPGRLKIVLTIPMLRLKSMFFFGVIARSMGLPVSIGLYVLRDWLFWR